MIDYGKIDLIDELNRRYTESLELINENEGALNEVQLRIMEENINKNLRSDTKKLEYIAEMREQYKKLERKIEIELEKLAFKPLTENEIAKLSFVQAIKYGIKRKKSEKLDKKMTKLVRKYKFYMPELREIEAEEQANVDVNVNVDEKEQIKNDVCAEVVNEENNVQVESVKDNALIADVVEEKGVKINESGDEQLQLKLNDFFGEPQKL